MLESSDPRRRAERLARSGLIDTALYAAQLGVPYISVDAAAAHYATVGYALDYTLNVLVDPFVVREGMVRTDRPALYDYFNSSAWDIETSAVWSVAQYRAEHPEAAKHPAGPVGHLWERTRSEPDLPITILAPEPREMPWSEAYAILAEATIEWADLQRRRATRALRSAPGDAESLALDGRTRGPRVSIVMPVWNRGGGMRRAVESVLAQAWQDWELLIVDDGSWDDTLSIAAMLAERDDRIHVIRREHEGVCAARNAGIAEASGTYIAFLDSDNTWLPNYLRDMVVSMSREGMTSAYATIAVDNGNDVRYRYGAQNLDGLILGNSIDLNTLIVRKDALERIGGFDPTLRRAVDYDLILRLAELAPIAHVPTLGAWYDNAEDAGDRISTTEAYGWNTAVRLRHTPVPPSPQSTDTTVVMLVQRRDPALAAKLATLVGLDAAHTEVVVAGVGIRPDEWRQIRACAHVHGSIAARLHQEGEAFAYVVNLELKRSRSDVLAVIDPRSSFTADGLTTLIDEVVARRSDAAIPLTLGTDGTVESVGSALVGATRNEPVPVLRNHPAEDARRLGDRLPLTALSGRTFAISRELLETAGGVDPLLFNQHELAGLSGALRGRSLTALTNVTFTQLDEPREFTATDPAGTMNALRAKELAAGDDVVDPYSLLGLRVAHWRRDIPQPTKLKASDTTPDASAALIPVVTRDRRDIEVDGRTVPRLRWAIKTASPAGPRGESWGDTHFGRSLASALESLGQEAVVDAREAQRRETDYLDEVVIHLRGLDTYEPSSGALSYLWVISHPDMVTRAEAQRFDRVFAASLSWSAQQSERWSRPVEPLLQCTDPELFQPGESSERGGPLFVGNSRGVPRPTVLESVRGGIPLELYGGDWTRFIPSSAVTAERLDNTQLGRKYAAASVVLNDHWSDMQREGFISNRLFDVVAAGGRVFSDGVAGIEEIFGGAVQTYRTVSEIVPFLSGDIDSQYPADEEMRAISERIRDEHSFVARARVLLDRAIEDLRWQAAR